MAHEMSRKEEQKNIMRTTYSDDRIPTSL